MPRVKQIPVRLEPTLARRLTRVSEESGVSVNTILRGYVEELVAAWDAEKKKGSPDDGGASDGRNRGRVTSSTRTAMARLLDITSTTR